jgi:signal transduction histidine kinase
MSGMANGAIPSPAAADLRQEDLGELLAAFNEATSRLHGAHEALRAEVARLQGELREANEQLERSRRLAALGEMAAGIAHEVRNPLGGIRLYARMLVQDLADRPEERRVAEKIVAAVRGLDAVVGDVLNFAREMRVQPVPASARALLEGAAEEVLAEDRGSAGEPIRVVLHADEGLAVECDEQLVHRALVNVVRNAVQAMRSAGAAPAGGHALSLGAAAAGDGESVTLTVRDTGPGVPPEAMERIFNPFFTTRATGTGLGLAIVHRIVDAHGGSIRVRNAEGGGAEVDLSLPRRARPAGDDRSRAEGPRVQVRVGAVSAQRGRVREEAA